MRDAAKFVGIVTEIFFYFSALQNINLPLFTMFVSWQVPIAMFAIQSTLQENVHRMTAFECRMMYIFLHSTSYHASHYQNMTTKCRPYKSWNTNFPYFPYFSVFFLNFPENFPEIFRNIIFRKIYITSASYEY